MKLKKLDIYGFKSFADRTHMEFDDGITGVVGPNGSGKSNISDAVRWVLGEQSARTLRGNKMEDVIFNGTEKRKPMAYCEVSLTLDNADGALPVQYNEVQVTRRVYRNGDSEYYLNKSACRLKTIVDLFRDTGIGKEGYSLIGQGRIDEILSQKSEDRRAVFEEAAGIARYKARRAEAQRKIDATNQNLTRAEDIIAEAERQLGPLQRQAEKAKRYIALFDELRSLDVSQFVIRFDSIKQRLNQNEGSAADRRAAITEAQTQYDGLKRRRDELDEAQQRADSADQELRDNVVELTRALEAKQGDHKLLTERGQAQRADAERLASERDAAAKAARDIDETLVRRRADLKALSAEVDAETEALDSEDAGLARETEKLAAEAEELDDRKANLMEALNRLSDVKSAKARLTAMRQAINERIDECDAACTRLKSRVSALNDVLSDDDEAIESAEAEVAQARQTLSQLQSELDANRDARIKATDKLQQLHLARQQTETRLKVLREMARDYEGYQYAVKQVMMRAEKTGDKGIVGVLASVLKVPQELERAADMVLGGALQNIIVETEQDAKRMIEYLRQNRYGRATFLPVSAVTGRTLNAQERQALNAPGCIGVMSELIQFEPRYKGIVDNLLGRTVVARDLDAGIEIMRRGRHAFRLVTLQGDVMHSGGSMTGGSVQSKVTNLLSRDREIAEHEQALTESDAQIATAQRAQRRTEEERQALHARQDEGRTALRKLEDELLTLRQQRTQDEREADRIKGELKDMEQERSNLGENLSDVMRELSGITGSQGAAETSHEQMKREIAQQQVSLDERRKALDQRRETLTARRITLAGKRRDREATTAEITRLEGEQAAQTELIEDRRRGLEANAAAQREIEARLVETAAELERLKAETDAAKAELDAADTDRESRQARRREVENGMEARQGDITEFTEQLHRLEMLIDREQRELENLTARIWKDYELTYDACAEIADRSIALGETDRRIGQLRGEIRELGSVNVNAAEEYATELQRYTELTSQRDDLLRAQADLDKIITELTEQMRTQFVAQFALLNERFQVAFKALFGGGSARLMLQDENDPLSCGIDIAAQPPGKKLQMLSLLSGGERALTAIAILFAMLDIRPTPFCILDEIEAALDDANIDNFTQYLESYTSRTQFIVVTHRKGTMECCDALYGVAMEEKGVSRMVSVALDDLDKLNEG